MLYVFFGLIASGKSTLARAFAERRGCRVFNSDAVRKELAGQAATDSGRAGFGTGIYTPEFTERTYAELFRRAMGELAAGRPVVLDASFAGERERNLACQCAKENKVAAVFIWCRADEATTLARLAKRALDPTAVSDGRPEIYQQQKKRFAPPENIGGTLIVINTDRPVSALLADLFDHLNSRLRPDSLAGTPP